MILLTLHAFLTLADGSINIKLAMSQDNPPYYYKHNSTHHKGIIIDMFNKGLITICNQILKMKELPKHLSTHREVIDLITTRNQQEIYNKLNYSSSADGIIAVGATTYKEPMSTYPNFHKKAILPTKAALIVSSGELLLLVKFVRTFSKCLIVVFFAIMCAIILSAIVWFIERLSGNPDFQETFGAGLWTSFWFAFVTMSTVGYGDKVPKHPLSRIVSIAWIVYGVMLIALITSVVWTSVNADYSTKDQEVDHVLSDTSESEIVLNHLHGIPNNTIPITNLLTMSERR